MLTPVLIMVFLAVVLGVVLGFAAIRFRVEGNPLVETISAKLPQTQCGQCGYPGCKPYAEAIADGRADINLCVPGGDNTAKSLSELLGVEFKPVGGGGEGPKPKQVAFIDENTCIGCTACIKVCPVDAIIGSNKVMHTILAQQCTGCELCVPACPVDCISMIPIEENLASWKWKYPVHELKKAA